MSKPKGYWAWRIANPSLPAPTEFRAMPDGGTPVEGGVDENFHDPDYFSQDFSLTTERDLTRALAQYV